jgi:hypothetical protein
MSLNDKHTKNTVTTLQEISMEEIKLPVKSDTDLLQSFVII